VTLDVARGGPGQDHPSKIAADQSIRPGPQSATAHRQDRSGARRLDATLRLAPLPDGTRDPSISWDACPTPGELVIEVGLRHTAWLQGPSKVVVPLLATLGSRWQYEGQAGGWAFPRKYVDDVLALADLERRPIRLRSVER